MKEIIKTKNEPYNKNNLWLNDGLHEYKDGKWISIGGGSKYYYYSEKSAGVMPSDLCPAMMYITEVCHNAGPGTSDGYRLKKHTTLDEYLDMYTNGYDILFYFCTNTPLMTIPEGFILGPAPIQINSSINDWNDEKWKISDKFNNYINAFGMNEVIIEYTDNVDLTGNSIKAE